MAVERAREVSTVLFHKREVSESGLIGGRDEQPGAPEIQDDELAGI